MKTVGLISKWLLIVGGLNWGLVGIAHLDLVAWALGTGSLASQVVYGLVGLAALYESFYEGYSEGRCDDHGDGPKGRCCSK